MACTLIVFPKKSPKTESFFEIIDHYFTAQGLQMIGKKSLDEPRVYFISSNVPPNVVRGLVATIKNTGGYSAAVREIQFSAALTKG